MSDSLITFGVDENLTLVDKEIVTFAVMVNMECKIDDREVTVARPAYEYSLLKKRYEIRGGTVNVLPNWLYHPKTGAECHPRKVPLSRKTLLEELKRCQSSFKMRGQGGELSHFDWAFGKGVECRFVKVVNTQAKAYKMLEAKCVAEKRHPTHEELLDICQMSMPPVEGEIDIEKIEFDPATLSVGMTVSDAEDPAIELASVLVEKGHTPEVANEVARLHTADKVTAGTLGMFVELAQKPEAIRKVLSDYKIWVATQTKPATAPA